MSGSAGMDWEKRFKVAVGVAEGLHYLHKECPRRIIHRDIKASNILLNENYEAEVLWHQLIILNEFLELFSMRRK